LCSWFYRFCWFSDWYFGGLAVVVEAGTFLGLAVLVVVALIAGAFLGFLVITVVDCFNDNNFDTSITSFASPSSL